MHFRHKMEMDGQLHAPAAFSPGKKKPVPTGQKAEWAPEPVWIRWRREKDTFPCWKSNPGRTARSLLTIL